MNHNTALPFWAKRYRALATAECKGLLLASLEDVEVVVKAFVGRAIRLWENEGGSAGERSKFAAGEARALTKVFFGRDADYQSTPWNDPRQLGYGFGDRVGIAGSAEEVMPAFWVRLADQVFDLLDRDASGALSGEAADFQCQVHVEEARYALVGLLLTAE